ncbi:hypothetical protein LTR84_004600 [Exophiala bonariae]|uniref:Uncharacterized protein n=1 Tax=Exophiala bonariae TaxID=1690606 RepID=A0AAV9NMT6_9EURO|nr:hypothetical protein LTR84_004600 [Exophiala bonariae]
MKSFKPNCTLPHDSYGYVSGVDIRSTLDIVWSCLGILLLCTWQIQHLNVPRQISSTTVSERARRYLYQTCIKAKWMVITVLAPEIISGKACADWLSAKGNVRKMNESSFTELAEGTVQWTYTHSFFADMGGIEIHFPPRTTLHVDQDPKEVGSAEHAPFISLAMRAAKKDLQEFSVRQALAPWSSGLVDWRADPVNERLVVEALQSATAADLKLNHLYREWFENLAVLQGNIWILDANQLRLAREQGVIKCLPNIREDDLGDRDKSDALIKFLSVLQVLWLIIELIVRKSQDLGSSQLEIVTVAYAACSAATYALLLYKPQGVQQPFAVVASRYPTPLEMIKIAAEGPFPYIYGRQGHWMPNNAFHYVEFWVYFRGFLVGSVLGATIFGCIHCIAWNFTFPTQVERLLWRIASVLTVAVPWITMAVNPFTTSSRIVDRIWWGFLFSSAGVYIVARLFITVEIFRTLYFLPPNAYTATWSINFPQFG